jgi:hypothetical protein
MQRKHITPDWRAQQLEALRDGRKNRAKTFRSPKDYRRKAKNRAKTFRSPKDYRRKAKHVKRHDA